MDIGMILGYIVLLVMDIVLLVRDMGVSDALREAEREIDRERAEKLMYKTERDTVMQRDAAKRSHECRIRDAPEGAGRCVAGKPPHEGAADRSGKRRQQSDEEQRGGVMAIELTGVTCQDFIDMICKVCHTGKCIERGLMDEIYAEPVCDTCPVTILAEEICCAAGIK